MVKAVWNVELVVHVNCAISIKLWFLLMEFAQDKLIINVLLPVTKEIVTNVMKVTTWTRLVGIVSRVMSPLPIVDISKLITLVNNVTVDTIKPKEFVPPLLMKSKIAKSIMMLLNALLANQGILSAPTINIVPEMSTLVFVDSKVTSIVWLVLMDIIITRTISSTNYLIRVVWVRIQLIS